MATIRNRSGFIHPFHFNRNHLIGYMTQKGIVEVEGEKYAISPSDFFTDEAVHLFLRQDQYETESEYNARLEREKAAHEAHLKRQEELQEQARLDAIERQKRLEREFEEFKSSYNIPFKYSFRIKPVLSGLSENSMGNGAKRNTVIHLFVEDSMDNGRLKRSANTFLCSPNDSGKWSNLDDYTYNSPVCCKSCLRIMKRWLVAE